MIMTPGRNALPLYQSVQATATAGRSPPSPAPSQRRPSHLVVSQASIDKVLSHGARPDCRLWPSLPPCSRRTPGSERTGKKDEWTTDAQQRICGVDWQTRRVWNVGWLAVGSDKRKRYNPPIATTATPALRRQCAEPLFSPLRRGLAGCKEARLR